MLLWFILKVILAIDVQFRSCLPLYSLHPSPLLNSFSLIFS
jgi:hypothetical protein